MTVKCKLPLLRLCHLRNEFIFWKVRGTMNTSGLLQNLCDLEGYDRLQKSIDSLKDCFENVYIMSLLWVGFFGQHLVLLVQLNSTLLLGNELSHWNSSLVTEIFAIEWKGTNISTSHKQTHCIADLLINMRMIPRWLTKSLRVMFLDFFSWNSWPLSQKVYIFNAFNSF